MRTGLGNRRAPSHPEGTANRTAGTPPIVSRRRTGAVSANLRSCDVPGEPVRGTHAALGSRPNSTAAAPCPAQGIRADGIGADGVPPLPERVQLRGDRRVERAVPRPLRAARSAAGQPHGDRPRRPHRWSRSACDVPTHRPPNRVLRGGRQRRRPFERPHRRCRAGTDAGGGARCAGGAHSPRGHSRRTQRQAAERWHPGSVPGGAGASARVSYRGGWHAPRWSGRSRKRRPHRRLDTRRQRTGPVDRGRWQRNYGLGGAQVGHPRRFRQLAIGGTRAERASIELERSAEQDAPRQCHGEGDPGRGCALRERRGGRAAKRERGRAPAVRRGRRARPDVLAPLPRATLERGHGRLNTARAMMLPQPAPSAKSPAADVRDVRREGAVNPCAQLHRRPRKYANPASFLPPPALRRPSTRSSRPAPSPPPAGRTPSRTGQQPTWQTPAARALTPAGPRGGCGSPSARHSCPCGS